MAQKVTILNLKTGATEEVNATEVVHKENWTVVNDGHSTRVLAKGHYTVG